MNDRRDRLVLFVLCLGPAMTIIDNTVVNVALPAIQRDLGFSASGLSWVVDAYLVTFGGFLLLSGRIGDLLGNKRVLLGGLVLFTASSLLSGISSSQGLLLAGRFVQGVGAATVSSTSLGLVATRFHEHRARARAMAVYGFVSVSGGSLGLFLGGLIVEALDWHWIFFINVPVGVVLFGACWAWVDDRPGLGIRKGADVTGALLITLAPMLAVYGLVTVDQRDWASARTVAALVGAIALVALFVAVERRLRHPLIRLGILRNRNMVLADVVRGLYGIGTFGLFFLGVLYFQKVRGYDALVAGLAYVPFTVTSSTVSLTVTARLMFRIGARATLLAGLVIFTAGIAIMRAVPVHGSYAGFVLPGLLLAGAGGGLTSAPNITLALSGVRTADTGLASGLMNVAVQLGAALGIAGVATISAIRTRHVVGTGPVTSSALTAGYHLGFTVAGACTAVGAALILLIRSPRHERDAAEPAVATRADGAGPPSDPAAPRGRPG